MIGKGGRREAEINANAVAVVASLVSGWTGFGLAGGVEDDGGETINGDFVCLCVCLACWRWLRRAASQTQDFEI